MNKFLRFFAPFVTVLLLASCSGMGNKVQMATSLYDQLGGAQVVNTVAGNFLQNAAGTGQLSSLLSQVDLGAAIPQVSNQLCAMLGGGCKAPFTAEQIAAAGSKLTPQQSTALRNSFSSALDQSGVNAALKAPIDKALGSQLGGIVGSLL